MQIPEEIAQHRKPEYPINPLILSRWSARAMSGEEVTDEELMALFEAGRWAPSSYNAQPWRFIYAKKGSEHWDIFFDLLVDFNKSWAKNAGVLVLIISRRHFEHNENPSHTHSFDAGAAWENMAIEAETCGLVTHGMEGFDYQKAREVLEIPDVFQVEAMIVIGKKGRKEDLPEGLREKEVPSTRKPLAEIVMEGKFKA